MVYWHLSSPVFDIQRRDGLEWLECEALRRLPWLRHGFSLRRGGMSAPPAEGLNLGFTPTDSREAVEENRRRFFRALGVADFLLADLQQIHSARTIRATRAGGAVAYSPDIASGPGAARESPPKGPTVQSALRPEADVLVTDEPGVLLAIRTADCLPILIADPQKRAIAAVHAGWRGTLAGVTGAAVAEMARAFGSNPASLVAALGPSIRACCYEVGPEVEEAFRKRSPENQKFFLRPSPEARVRLDLVAAAEAALGRSGVPAAQIHVADFCTACRTDLFFSHRKEGAWTGRMMAVTGIVSP
jgi:purine-nucleoside/S-methyl-5'-thioadenosine phosphorylase / adenosine deaminase